MPSACYDFIPLLDSPLVARRAAQRLLAASEIRRLAFVESRLRVRLPPNPAAARWEWNLFNIEIAS